MQVKSLNINILSI